jgi:hypothetical protein
MENRQTLQEIYESYRDQMAATLALEEVMPERFADLNFVREFERRVERLDALITLYASLLSSRQK